MDKICRENQEAKKIAQDLGSGKVVEASQEFAAFISRLHNLNPDQQKSSLGRFAQDGSCYNSDDIVYDKATNTLRFDVVDELVVNDAFSKLKSSEPLTQVTEQVNRELKAGISINGSVQLGDPLTTVRDFNRRATSAGLGRYKASIEHDQVVIKLNN